MKELQTACRATSSVVVLEGLRLHHQQSFSDGFSWLHPEFDGISLWETHIFVILDSQGQHLAHGSGGVHDGYILRP